MRAKKRKRVIGDCLFDADVRERFQSNKPSADNEIVHCIVCPLNNGIE